MKHALSFIFLTISCSLGFSQDKNPIDLALDNCLSNAPTTVQVTACFTESWEAWDQVLNQSYKEYRNLLSNKGRLALTNAQRQWINFRDEEFKRIDHHYFTELGGTMWTAAALDEKVTIIKRRALEFKSNAEDIKMNKES